MTATATPGYMPYLIVALIAFSLYRRIRSQFGRQPWRPALVTARIAMLSVVLAMLVVVAAMHPVQNWGMLAGAVVGGALGVIALRLVRIDTADGKAGYTPNPWIGAALTALLAARIAWRFSTGGFSTPQPAGPLTFAIATTVVVFYLVQAIGLMRRMKGLTAGLQATTG